jgi:hypothetical protein
MPGSKSVTVYEPAELVAVVFFTFVASFVTVTVALPTTAPELSVTVPVMLANACAFSLAWNERMIAKNPNASKTLRMCQCRRVHAGLSWKNLLILFNLYPFLMTNLGDQNSNGDFRAIAEIR